MVGLYSFVKRVDEYGKNCYRQVLLLARRAAVHAVPSAVVVRRRDAVVFFEMFVVKVNDSQGDERISRHVFHVANQLSHQSLHY